MKRVSSIDQLTEMGEYFIISPTSNKTYRRIFHALTDINKLERRIIEGNIYVNNIKSNKK